MIVEKKRRGGARQGAGRKTTSPKSTFSFRLLDEVRDKMKDIENKSEYINNVLLEHFRNKCANIRANINTQHNDLQEHK